MTKVKNESGVRTYTAGVTFAAKQFYLCVLDSTVDQVILATADSDIPFGVVLNKPASGEQASVKSLNHSGSQTMIATDAISIGDYVVADLVSGTPGKIRTMTGLSSVTVYIVGRALEAATADGDEIEIELINANQRVIA